ncbi:hypothetical protein FWH13_00965 [Candidatus Saccharibacteria bacterium]|nr:hypothetical protein [Candidatus Saccharibacteria bacterium]
MDILKILAVTATGGTPGTGGVTGGINSAGGSSNTALPVQTLVTNAMGWMAWGAGVLSVIFIIVGGIRYITSGGDAEKVKKAKNTILYACIGLAVAILAGAIALFIANTASTTT